MKVVFLIGIIQALFFSVLVFNKSSKSTADKILGVWLLILGIQLIVPYLLYGDNYQKYIHLGGIDTPLIALHSAMLYVYTCALMSRINKFQTKWLWNFIPALLGGVVLLPYLLLSREEKLLLYENKMQLTGSMYMFVLLVVLTTVFYIIRTLLELKKHKEIIHQEYSYEQDIDLKWLQSLVKGISALAILITIGSITIKLKGVTLLQGDFILYTFLVIFIYAIGYWGFKQGKVFSYQTQQQTTANHQSVAKKQPGSKKENKLNVDFGTEERNFITNLKKLMEQEKPYTNNELNLYDLASALNVSSGYLSHILNTCLHVNFYQFINQYRVDEAKKLINNNKNQRYTLLAIAYESGFNSKASFNRIFKDLAQMTPSEYQNSLE